MGASQQYDAIIVGGGHNGLVAACYLADAGIRTLVLERYHEVGGAAFSEEYIPGFTFSTGSYVLSLMPESILNDLRLREEGIEYVERNPRFFAPFPDGSSLTYWNDHQKWLQDIRRISPRDADAYDHYDADLERACQVMDKYILRRPPSWAEVAAEFRTPYEAGLFQKFFLGSAADIAEYYFESEQMRATVAALGLIGTFRGPRDAGTGYVKLFHSMGMATGHRGRWTYVRGAMGSITQTLAKIARKRGVEIRTEAEVERIVVRDGRVQGVALASGEEFTSGIVLSNADPKRTYLRLVDAGDLPEDYRRAIEQIKIDSPVMKINMAVEELPKFTALGDDSERQLQGSTGGLFVAPSLEYMQRAYEDARQGRPSDHPFMSIHMQSAVDPSVAPPGKHTISIFAQYFPYALAEGTWESRRQAIADAVVAEFGKYAPNVPSAVIGMQVLAPPDLEARFGLTGGHIFHGELVPEQAFDLRPVPGSSSYEGPIGGLFLCGSGAWPGGCVMGAPGHNAAQEVIARFSDVKPVM
ncbi:MAG: NAD(P)/FAD-dependent oxidoreductase [Thermomicrobiales bacterium]|nr:NAD(P)/FAD-dependent oxidoreductase [Thermomicrobiales bacterium]